MTRTTCSIEGCERPVYARGWCAGHWYRWRHHGSPSAGRPLGQYGSSASDVCSIEGCERPIAARGWCRTHYRRWLRHGSPLVRGEIETPVIGAQRFCSVAGCNRPHEARGFCSMHRARWLRHGSTELPPGKPTPPCSVVSCDRPARTRGLCDKHYQRWRVHGSVELLPRTPMDRPGCSVEGCDQSAKARGFCHKQYMAYRRRDPETRQRVLDYGRQYRRRYQARTRDAAQQHAPHAQKHGGASDPHTANPTPTASAVVTTTLAGTGGFGRDVRWSEPRTSRAPTPD